MILWVIEERILGIWEINTVWSTRASARERLKNLKIFSKLFRLRKYRREDYHP